MIKLSSLLKEIKVIPSDDRLVIQLSATDEDGEARDKTTLIFPKHGSQLDPEDKAYLESEEVGIPEESGFFVYLDLALKDFENKIQQLGDNPDRSQVEDLIIELVKDLSKYIEENEAYSIEDTSPRDDIADNIKEKFEELFPTVNPHFVGLGWFTFSNGLVESLVEGDPSFLIDFTFGDNADINEIKVKAAMQLTGLDLWPNLLKVLRQEFGQGFGFYNNLNEPYPSVKISAYPEEKAQKIQSFVDNLGNWKTKITQGSLGQYHVMLYPKNLARGRDLQRTLELNIANPYALNNPDISNFFNQLKADGFYFDSVKDYFNYTNRHFKTRSQIDEEFQRMQKLAGIINEIKAVPPSIPYKYAYLEGREDLYIFTQQDFDDYVEEISEIDFDGNKEGVIDWMENDNELVELPNSPYLFIFANDESIGFIDANNKEEFAEIISTEFHLLEGNPDEVFQVILDIANDSEIDGDSGYAQVVIENNKIIAGPYNFVKDI
jgi:hypothetical protein